MGGKLLLVLSSGMLMLSVVASNASDLGRTENYNWDLVCQSDRAFHSILVNNNKKVLSYGLLNNHVRNKSIFYSCFTIKKLD